MQYIKLDSHLSVSQPDVHLHALLLEAEDLARDAPEVGLEAEEHVLHPCEDAITAGDLGVQLCYVPCLTDVVLTNQMITSLFPSLAVVDQGRNRETLRLSPNPNCLDRQLLEISFQKGTIRNGYDVASVACLYRNLLAFNKL